MFHNINMRVSIGVSILASTLFLVILYKYKIMSSHFSFLKLAKLLFFSSTILAQTQKATLLKEAYE